MHWLRNFLEISGGVQLGLSLLGTLGLNLVGALSVAAVIEPNTTWDYLMLVAVFSALTPVTFPLSAFALNFALSQVDKARKKVILDSPVDTARKLMDSLIADAKRLSDTIPATFDSSGEATYHEERWNHFLMRADSDIARVAGQHAAHCFMADDREEAWRGTETWDPDSIKSLYSSAVKRLGVIRDDLPIDRTKWLRVSYSIDITSGQKLTTFLRAGTGTAEADQHGRAEVETWAHDIYTTLRREGVANAHVFAPETRTPINSLQDRIDYAESHVAELQSLWGAL
jgi:hypothetical protein